MFEHLHKPRQSVTSGNTSDTTSSTIGVLRSLTLGPSVEDRLQGVLLGTAVYDALGLAAENLSPATIQRSIPLNRYSIIKDRGIVSDDTEHSVLAALTILDSKADQSRAREIFSAHLRRWMLGLPLGAGKATVRASVKSLLGIKASGTNSLGNGGLMKAPILGAYFANDREKRTGFVKAISSVTHASPVAIQAARYVAEIAADCMRQSANNCTPLSIINTSKNVLSDPALTAAVEKALALVRLPEEKADPVATLGNSGFLVHTVGLTTYFFARYASDPARGVEAIIRCGGDTDSNAAILGGWFGALHGTSYIPPHLIATLEQGPYGRTVLLGLGAALAVARNGTFVSPARPGVLASLGRSATILPSLLRHALIRRLR
jgi:ADP-ribosyl-[dinitrogen reductase] hydrolase